MLETITKQLGSDAASLLGHECKTISKDRLHLPGPDFVDRIFLDSDRNARVLGNLEWILKSGRLAGTGYVSILPVDQGIEHSAGASFAPNPDYFDPENIVKLAIEGGCNAVASTFGLSTSARKIRTAKSLKWPERLNTHTTWGLPRSSGVICAMMASIRMALIIMRRPT